MINSTFLMERANSSSSSSFKNRPKGVFSCVPVAVKVVASMVVTSLEHQIAEVKDS